MSRSHLARGTLWILAGMLFQQGMGYVNTVLALRFVDVAVYGTMVFVVSFANLCVPLARQGLHFAVTKFVSERVGAADPPAARAIFSELKWLVLLGAGALSLLGPALHGWLPEAIGSAISRPVFAGCFGALVLISALASANQHGLLGLKRFVPRAVSGFFVEPVARIALIGLLLPQLPNVAGLAVTYAVPLLAAYLASEWWLWRQGFRLGRPRFARAGTFYRFSLPLVGTGFFGLLMFQADRVLLGYMASPEVVGLYNVAARVALLVIAPFWAAGQVFAPVIAEQWSAGRFERLRSAYQTVTAHSVFLLGSLYALLVVNADWILRLFGEEFATPEIRRVLSILGAGLVFATLPGHNGVLYRMSGRTWLSAATTAVAGVANVGLNLLLIPRLGMLGAALGTAIALAGVNLVGLLLFRVSYQMQVHPFCPRWFAALAAVVVLGAGAHWLQPDHAVLGSAFVLAGTGLWLWTLQPWDLGGGLLQRRGAA